MASKRCACYELVGDNPGCPVHGKAKPTAIRVIVKTASLAERGFSFSLGMVFLACGIVFLLAWLRFILLGNDASWQYALVVSAVMGVIGLPITVYFLIRAGIAWLAGAAKR